jgi:hypothetical protein
MLLDELPNLFCRKLVHLPLQRLRSKTYLKSLTKSYTRKSITQRVNPRKLNYFYLHCLLVSNWQRSALRSLFDVLRSSQTLPLSLTRSSLTEREERQNDVCCLAALSTSLPGGKQKGNHFRARRARQMLLKFACFY